jgi:hypothetical protein
MLAMLSYPIADTMHNKRPAAVAPEGGEQVAAKHYKRARLRVSASYASDLFHHHHDSTDRSTSSNSSNKIDSSGPPTPNSATTKSISEEHKPDCLFVPIESHSKEIDRKASYSTSSSSSLHNNDDRVNDDDDHNEDNYDDEIKGSWKFRQSLSGVSVSSTHTECSDDGNDNAETYHVVSALSSATGEGMDGTLSMKLSSHASPSFMDVVAAQQIDSLTSRMSSWSITNMKALRRNNIYDSKLRQQQVDAARREVIRAMQRPSHRRPTGALT